MLPLSRLGPNCGMGAKLLSSGPAFRLTVVLVFPWESGTRGLKGARPCRYPGWLLCECGCLQQEVRLHARPEAVTSSALILALHPHPSPGCSGVSPLENQCWGRPELMLCLLMSASRDVAGSPCFSLLSMLYEQPMPACFLHLQAFSSPWV